MRSRFKGTDSTFENFPSRLQHILSESERDLPVECVVFPAYEVSVHRIAVEEVLTLNQTKGELVGFPPPDRCDVEPIPFFSRTQPSCGSQIGSRR